MFNVAKTIQAGGKELQDRAAFFQLGSTLVLVVADGAGGLSGGAEAAEFVVHRLQELASPLCLSAEGLRDLLEKVDREMADLGTFGETTAVVVALSEKGIAGASVGDSGAWALSPSKADDLTASQSRKPFIGSGRAIPVSFSRNEFAGTLLLASDGLLKYASQQRIASVAQATDLNEGIQSLVALVRYPSGALPDDVAILLARKT
jgi:serine/threonine protein phosphatase PrpC